MVKKTTKKTNLYAKIQVRQIVYDCPHCKEVIRYDTTEIPETDKCLKCLKPLKFKVVYLQK